MVLAVDLIGFPFIWLLMKGIPKVKIEQHSISFSQWFTYLCMSEALIIAGSMIGNSIHSALTLPFSGNDLNNATNLMQNSNVVIRTLVVGIGAPVFEELIFRKVLIDRTIKYGEYVSIVLSGMMFGLLHGNFQQFFFAALIGMLFAYIYIRTGRVRYTIFLHMAINLSSALVLQTLLQFRLIITGTSLCFLLRKYPNHIHNGKIPFFLFRIPGCADGLILKKLKLFLIIDLLAHSPISSRGEGLCLRSPPGNRKQNEKDRPIVHKAASNRMQQDKRYVPSSFTPLTQQN